MKHLGKSLERLNDYKKNFLNTRLSNLSVDKIYSIVALRMSLFCSLSNNVYDRACDKEKLDNSSILQ